LPRLLTCARQHKQGHRLTPVAFIVCGVVATALNSSVTSAAFRAPSNNEIITGSLPSPAQQEEQLRHAKEGTEGLELVARLSETSSYIKRPVEWTVFERDPQMANFGKQVYHGVVSLADISLKPGQYRIEAKYGYATTAKNVTILPQTRLAVSLNLQVGGIRTLSKVFGVNANNYANATHKIYRLQDNKPVKLITDKVSQGEIIRLSAGEYKIESRFELGNTLAVAKVTIKPGILTSLNIEHQASMARLQFVKQSQKEAKWTVTSLKSGPNGRWSKSGTSKTPNIILAPGRYQFAASINGKKFIKTLTLERGKAATILLGK